jgi:general secretion pathway protein L
MVAAGRAGPESAAPMSSIANPPSPALRFGIGRALAWWLGELQAVCIDAERWLRQLVGDTLAIEAGERRWRLRRRNNIVGEIDWAETEPGVARRRLRELAAPADRPATVIVEIPPERVLGKVIDLPAGAQGEIDRILAFEIARHFPFPAERVFYRYRLAAHADRSGMAALPVEIVAVPREIVASINTALAAAGLRAAGIAVVPARNSAPLFLGRDALPARPHASARRRRWAVGLALLAAAAAASWPVAQQVRLAALQREIAALTPRAETALRARERRGRQIEQAAAIARLREARLPLVAIVDALSREVPDGAWLASLSVAGRDIVIEGLAPSATTIALALGRNPNFANIMFRAPTARDPATGLERFQLGASVAGAGR